MKKSYTLFITISLVTIFSFVGVFILETKSLKNESLTNEYLYIQAKNHMNFFKDYIKDLDLKDINYLQIEDDFFDIYANITYKNSNYIINIHVKSKNYDISLYEKIVR